MNEQQTNQGDTQETKRTQSRPRRAPLPPAPPSPEFKFFCGQVGRLLGRITADCADGHSAYTDVATWFSQWFSSLGIACRYAYRQPNTYVGQPHYSVFCNRADGPRSAFYLFQLTGEEFIMLMQQSRYRVKPRKPEEGFVSDEQCQKMGEAIQCFLNAQSGVEPNIFERFLAAFANSE